MKELNAERHVELRGRLLKTYRPWPSDGIVCDPSAWKDLNTPLLAQGTFKC